MFEYLMPVLFFRNYPGTLVSESCETAIAVQMDYANEKHIPWGISESGFYSFDAAMNYQYRAFGVPELGYKRDLPDDLVVTPYASMIALTLQPHKVYENLLRFEKRKMIGRFGLYEAIDYTKGRLPAGHEYGIVQSYMAHHQGMILIAACNYLADEVMIRRFNSDERIKSVELLLQEKIPDNPHIEYPHPDEPGSRHSLVRPANSTPWRVPVQSPVPQVHFLSGGNYSVLITNAGGGYSQWEEFALTRWHSDTTLDNWGNWLYIKDLDSGALWSAGCQPIGCQPDSQEVIFFPHKAEFHRWDNNISIHNEITVGTDDVEVRRVTLHNDSDHIRHLSLTSYAEVALAPLASDQRHPAFNKLFIVSEYLPDKNALLFYRRPRSSEEKPVFLAHAVVVEPGSELTGEYESNRMRFLGRGRSLRSPLALDGTHRELSRTIGETLDPIMSLAQEITIKPHTRPAGLLPYLCHTHSHGHIGTTDPLQISFADQPRV